LRLQQGTMLRVTRISNRNGAPTLCVEGRLTTQTAEELRMETRAVLTQTGALQLDVSGLQFADRTGAALLRDLERRGAQVEGRSGFVEALLRDDDAPTAVSAPDAPLVARLRGGDAAAYEQVVREHGGRMLATARRMLRVEEDARDAVQEAFISAFRAVDGFAGTARLSTWLHRITVNAALMKLRSRRCRREDAIEDLLPRFVEDGHFAEAQREWEAPADELLEQRETRAEVRAAIDQLPENYRAVLILRDIEELDTDETAAALGVTPNTVKTRLHRARQALRTLLERAPGLARVRTTPAATPERLRPRVR
jgi:RNA polymerase sigma-70 factor (ECF subfamily)